MPILATDIKSKKLCIELAYFTDPNMEDSNIRRYYDSELNDGRKKLLLTSTEPDNPEEKQCKIIEKEFLIVHDFITLVKDFEFSRFTNYHIQSGFNSPPKYSYYQINYIDNKYKALFLKHLIENISGYAKGDLSKDEELNIFIWKEYLQNNN